MSILKQRKLIRVIQEENKYIKNAKKPIKIKAIDNLKEKIPDKLNETLEKMFLTAFNKIFLNGDKVIEKTYSKQKLKDEFYKNEALLVNEDKKSLNEIQKTQHKKTNLNLAIGTIKGAGLGLLGIGPMDIPVFVGQILKAMYEISLSYGYDYSDEKEKIFILKIIKTALLDDDSIIKNNMQIDKIILNEKELLNYDLTTEINGTSKILSQKLLFSKFVQGLPVIGILGGGYDGLFLQKILKYAKLKYYHRYLQNNL